MGLRVQWSPETIDLFTAALGRDRHRRYLVVERLPEGGWDWVTWQGDRAGTLQPGILQTGIADTAATAMADAVRAASLLAACQGLFQHQCDDRLQSVVGKPK